MKLAWEKLIITGSGVCVLPETVRGLHERTRIGPNPRVHQLLQFGGENFEALRQTLTEIEVQGPAFVSEILTKGDKHNDTPATPKPPDHQPRMDKSVARCLIEQCRRYPARRASLALLHVSGLVGSTGERRTRRQMKATGWQAHSVRGFISGTTFPYEGPPFKLQFKAKPKR